MALVMPVFFDTNVLVSGLVSVGPARDSSRQLMSAVAEGQISRPSTAWHCCLELYSVVTRLPAEFRLPPEVALDLLNTEILSRFAVHDLPADRRPEFIRALEIERAAGGQVYDLHIAAIAKASGASLVVTNNRRHFLGLLRYDIRVLTAEEAALEI